MRSKFFTPKEAQIATYLSYKYETLETVYGRVRHLVEPKRERIPRPLCGGELQSPEELEKVLSSPYRRLLIHVKHNF
jgi:hypothetical protein